MSQPINEELILVRDGRYVGKNNRYWLELRVDLQEYKLISGEIQIVGPAVSLPLTSPGTGAGTTDLNGDASGGHDGDYRSVVGNFYASFRMTGRSGDKFFIEGYLPDGTVTKGRLELAPSMTQKSEDALTITLLINESDSGPLHQTVEIIEVFWAGDALREIGLGIATEEGVSWPGDNVTLVHPPRSGPTVTGVRECFERAGFEVLPAKPSVIPSPKAGWSESDIFAAMDSLMRSNPQQGMDAPSFDLELLALSRTDRGRLLGIMFDVNDCLPRQGAAVFVDTIRDIGPSERADAKIIETAVHELGHALNLVHRFDRAVRDSSSTSFMNYDWRFRGGEAANMTDPLKRVNLFWKEFGFRFDRDELKFLRHAPRLQIVPGGSPFGSACYWEAAQADNAVDPNGPWGGLKLWMTPPTGGTSFDYGQTVFIEVSLLNSGNKAIPVPRHALDIKAGQLDLLIQPSNPAAPAADRLASAKPFLPVVRRCFDIGPSVSSDPRLQNATELPSGIVLLQPGESMHTNVNLAYSAGGPIFAEPGSYDITPLLSFPPEGGGGLDQLVTGTTLTIRVAAPEDRTKQRDAQETLFRPDVAASLALGGSTALQKAADDLEDLRARRDRDSAGRDPVVPALTRSAGIQRGRAGSNREAAELLTEATRSGKISCFDPHTAAHTLRLAKQYQPQLRAREVDGLPATVVVDLWTRPKRGGVTLGGRVTGFLIGRSRPPVSQPASNTTGIHVFAPAATLPAGLLDEANNVYAEIIHTAPDGLTERINAERVDIVVGSDDVTPEIACIRLSRPAITPPVTLPIGLHHSKDNGDVQGSGDVAEYFGPEKQPVADAVSLQGDKLSGLASATDQPLADQKDSMPASPATTSAYGGLNLEDLLSWWPWCWCSDNCNEPAPDGTDDPIPPFGTNKGFTIRIDRPGSKKSDSPRTPAPGPTPRQPAKYTEPDVPGSTPERTDSKSGKEPPTPAPGATPPQPAKDTEPDVPGSTPERTDSKSGKEPPTGQNPHS